LKVNGALAYFDDDALTDEFDRRLRPEHLSMAMRGEPRYKLATLVSNLRDIDPTANLTITAKDLLLAIRSCCGEIGDADTAYVAFTVPTTHL
jgi:hypothetical protein